MGQASSLSFAIRTGWKHIPRLRVHQTLASSATEGAETLGGFPYRRFGYGKMYLKKFRIGWPGTYATGWPMMPRPTTTL